MKCLSDLILLSFNPFEENQQRNYFERIDEFRKIKEIEKKLIGKWDTTMHIYFPFHFKKAVNTFLLILKRNKIIIPENSLKKIFQHLSSFLNYFLK